METSTNENWLKRMPPVYHCTRRLLLQLLASTQKADRIFRYGLIADTANEILAVMTDIAFADKYENSPADRASFIRTAQVKMDEVKVRCRVIFDAKGMTRKGFSAVTDLERSVDDQLERWRNSTVK